jgi:hypothetical protein
LEQPFFRPIRPEANPGGETVNAKDLKKHLACLTLAGLVAGAAGVAVGASG